MVAETFRLTRPVDASMPAQSLFTGIAPLGRLFFPRLGTAIVYLPFGPASCYRRLQEVPPMIEFDPHREVLSGPAGELPVAADDQVTRKLAMLLEGHCNGLGATAAARKYGYSKQRYYQLLKAYRQGGGAALESAKRGPKTNYRRTPQLVQLVVRQRFLDPDASAAVISQKLTQAGWKISKRSVERVVAEFGLQKQTPRLPAAG